MASTDDLVLSMTVISEHREGRAWEATIKAMGFLRDHGVGFTGGARNRTLQYKAGAPQQRDQATCQGKASCCGTKGGSRKSCLCSCMERAPESQIWGLWMGISAFASNVLALNLS